MGVAREEWHDLPFASDEGPAVNATQRVAHLGNTQTCLFYMPTITFNAMSGAPDHTVNVNGFNRIVDDLEPPKAETLHLHSICSLHLGMLDEVEVRPS